jgi:replicative DNA helicase
VSDYVRLLEASAIASYISDWEINPNPRECPDPDRFISEDYRSMAQMMGKGLDMLQMLKETAGTPESKAVIEVLGLERGYVYPLSFLEPFVFKHLDDIRQQKEARTAAIQAIQAVKQKDGERAEAILREFVEREREDKTGKKVGNAIESAVEYYERIQKMLAGEKLETRIDTGVELYETCINSGIGGGLQRGQIGCIAARPGRGKSSFGFWTVDQALRADQELKACIFSLEMPAADVSKKFLDSAMGRAGAYFETLPSLFQLSAALEGAESSLRRLLIDDDTPKGADQLIAKANEYSRQGVSLFLLDYIQLIDCGDIAAEQLRVAYSEAVKKLTEDAKRNDRSWIILSQFGRSAEGRPPAMSDLKETSAIEENCHWIVGLHREALEGQGQVGLHPTRLQAHILKNRYGPAGEVWRFEADWKRNNFRRGNE